jgi:uncharacterized membrane protein YphA (DoxX/SURF4 family)
MKAKVVLALRIVAAAILLQTLAFKFTGAPESKYIFSTLGVEPFGRYFAGSSELLASALLLWPGLEVLGAAMASGIMVGAIASHLLILGIEVQDDGGLLFALAWIVFIACLLIIALRREHIPIWSRRLRQVLVEAGPQS